MKYITTKDASGEEIQLSYKDYGNGRPVVLIHGWPSSKDMWEYQIDDLVNAGLRVIKYDRRGFGKSSKPWKGYDYDALSNDLNAVMDQLDLKDAVLVGFSMGGGEVVRYLSRFGTSRVSKIILVSAVTPYLLKTDDNPEGVDATVFESMLKDMKEDRIGFLDSFQREFFGVNLLNHPVSEPLLDYYRALAWVALPQAMQQCTEAFAKTDFRSDVKAVNVPTLIIHGDSDKIVPKEVSSDKTSKMIANSEYVVYEGAPHGLFYTHRNQLSKDIVRFAK